MPEENTIRFAPDGAWMIFEPRFPYRGMGLTLSFCSFIGIFFIACALLPPMIHTRRLDFADLIYASFGAVVMFGFLIPGLYLRTRRMRVRIDAGGVSVKRGWCLYQKTRRHYLSEFEGITRTTEMIKKTGSTDSAIMAMGATFSGIGGVMAMANYKLVPVHVLTLVHRQRRQLDVILVIHPNPEFVNDVQTALAKDFSLNAPPPPEQ